MKTLINKANPAIRITAPEIESYRESDREFYVLPNADFHRLFKMENWNLVEEKSKETTLIINNKLIKKIVKAMFYGGAYTSTYRMSDCNSIHKAFDEFIELLKAQGWHYGMNGEITASK